jgi:hypothetical protein
VFVDNLAIVGAPAEPATVVIAPDAVTEEDNSPLPVAVNVAVPVAELRTLKYATPPEKLLPTRAVVIAVELSATRPVPRKLTVEVVEDKVIDSPVPSEAGAPAASVRVNLYIAPPVEPVIVVPCTAVIVAAVGVEPVVNDAVLVTKLPAIVAVDSARIFPAVLYAVAPVPTKNNIWYVPDASGVKANETDWVAVESPVAETYSAAAVQFCAPDSVDGLSPSCPVLLVSALSVPYRPEPLAALTHWKAVALGVDEEIAAVPGTAPFEVANEVAGADVTRAPTMIESPIA